MSKIQTLCDNAEAYGKAGAASYEYSDRHLTLAAEVGTLRSVIFLMALEMTNDQLDEVNRTLVRLQSVLDKKTKALSVFGTF